MAQLMPDDAVIALLHFSLPAEEAQLTFTADRETIHRVFYDLRQEAPEALGQLRFRKRYLFPESRALDQALSNLEATGLLRRKNEAPRLYFVGKAIHHAYERFVAERLQQSDIEEVRFEKLAASFLRSVSEA